MLGGIIYIKWWFNRNNKCNKVATTEKPLQNHIHSHEKNHTCHVLKTHLI